MSLNPCSAMIVTFDGVNIGIVNTVEINIDPAPAPPEIPFLEERMNRLPISLISASVLALAGLASMQQPHVIAAQRSSHGHFNRLPKRRKFKPSHRRKS